MPKSVRQMPVSRMEDLHTFAFPHPRRCCYGTWTNVHILWRSVNGGSAFQISSKFGERVPGWSQAGTLDAMGHCQGKIWQLGCGALRGVMGQPGSTQPGSGSSLPWIAQPRTRCVSARLAAKASRICNCLAVCSWICVSLLFFRLIDPNRLVPLVSESIELRPACHAGSGRKGGFITCFLARETYSPMGQAHGGPSTNARSPFG